MFGINHLFICEKPHLAEAVAKARAVQKKTIATKASDHWLVGDDAVTWLFGHVYNTAMPEAYSERYAAWNLGDLPIIPTKWRLEPVGEYRSHVRRIVSMAQEASVIVNAGDAGDEGQLLVDEVLSENGIDPFGPKVKRLWVRSVASRDLVAALNGMVANSTKRALHDAALGRQRADWLLGINLTRLWTKLGEQHGLAGQTISVGRVQTPTLRLVVDRDIAIESFSPITHFAVGLKIQHANGPLKAKLHPYEGMAGLDEEGRLIDRAIAERIVAKVSGKPGAVTWLTVERHEKLAPLPFSLSSLQQVCSKAFHLSAQKTAKVAQALYDEHGVISYPRTSSRYLPEAILKDEAPTIIANLRGIPSFASIASDCDLKLESPCWDDERLSDHHAIIPTVDATEDRLAKLSDIERKVFDLIARSFLAQFYGPYAYESTTAEIKVEGERFKANGRVIVSLGWKAIYSKAVDEDQDEDSEDLSVLPTMVKGDQVQILEAGIADIATQPPAPFGDGDLIEAMTRIDRYAHTPEQKKWLKNGGGLGTEATRADTIETLIDRGYIQRIKEAKRKPRLCSTPLGRAVIAMLPPEVSEPAATAIMEKKLDLVASGGMPLDAFLVEQITNLRAQIKQAVTGERAETSQPQPNAVAQPTTELAAGAACPVCGKGKMVAREVKTGAHKGRKFLGCSNYPACKHSVWPKQPRQDVPPPATPQISGHGKPCPTCGTGQMLTRTVKNGDRAGQQFLGCSNFPICKHSEWPK